MVEVLGRFEEELGVYHSSCRSRMWMDDLHVFMPEVEGTASCCCCEESGVEGRILSCEELDGLLSYYEEEDVCGSGL
jgi:hypothetical protein